MNKKNLIDRIVNIFTVKKELSLYSIVLKGNSFDSVCKLWSGWAYSLDEAFDKAIEECDLKKSEWSLYMWISSDVKEILSTLGIKEIIKNN